MVSRRLSRIGDEGFSLGELIVVIAVLGIIAVVAFPSFLSYLQAAQTRGAAQEVVTVLNLARQLAITRNQNVCFDPGAAGSSQVRFHLGTCAAGVWTGPGTDAAGNITLSNNAAFSAVPGASIVFTPLGAATPAGTFTVRNQANTSCMDVVVNATGRVAAGAHAGACP